MKKVLAILLAGMMTATAFAGCGGSGDASSSGGSSNASGGSSAKASGGKVDEAMFGDETDITLKVWAPDKGVSLAKQHIEEFKKMYPNIKFKKIDVVAQGEGEAATQLVNDPNKAADVFSFPSDQLNKLDAAKCLSPVSKAFIEDVTATNAESTVKAATLKDSKSKEDVLYAYPETNDNGYYLVYDKKVVSDDNAKTLEGILKACKDAKKEFVMDCGNGFYSCTFAFTAGAVIDGFEEDNETQKFKEYDEDEAVDTLMAFAKLMKEYKGTWKSQDPAQIASGFKNGTLGAGVDGSWNSVADKETLGNDFGATKLPTIKVGNDDKQLISMFGYKYLGVNAKTKFPRTAHILAYYLASEKCQQDRAEKLGWGPSNTKVSETEFVKNDVTLQAIAAQSQNAVAQVNIQGTFWQAMGTLGNEMMKDGWKPDDKAATKKLLETTISDVRDEG
ncbi:MAG: extracellular solute-binding protein [Ruminococcus sp.]|nr:extracellular solute-binding protein [Ruminococcus sp.]